MRVVLLRMDVQASHTISFRANHVVLLVWFWPLSVRRSLYGRSVLVLDIETLVGTAINRRCRTDSKVSERTLDLVLFWAEVA